MYSGVGVWSFIHSFVDISFFCFVSCSHNQSCSTLSQSSVPFLGGKQHSFLIHTHVFSSVFPAKRAVRGGFILATYINTHLRAGWGLGVPPTTVKVYIACWVHISLPPMLLLPWEQKKSRHRHISPHRILETEWDGSSTCSSCTQVHWPQGMSSRCSSQGRSAHVQEGYGYTISLSPAIYPRLHYLTFFVASPSLWYSLTTWLHRGRVVWMREKDAISQEGFYLHQHTHAATHPVRTLFMPYKMAHYMCNDLGILATSLDRTPDPTIASVSPNIRWKTLLLVHIRLEGSLAFPLSPHKSAYYICSWP